jgi:5-methylcytosine-specific restriction protein A
MASTPLTDLIKKISSEYSAAMNEPLGDHPMGHFIRKLGPQIIKKLLPKVFSDYIVKGSVGQGKWMSKPWIAILNPDVTEKASEGYFICYGFRTDTTSVNLALCQGQNEAIKQYGKKSSAALNKQADLMRMKISEFETYFSAEPNKDPSSKAKYRQGDIYIKEYEFNDLPSESVLLDDLFKMLEAYETLFFRGGRDSDAFDDDGPSTDKEIAIEERHKKRVHFSIERPSSSKIKAIKKKLGYKCQVCGFDFEEKYGALGKEYIEAHHLIPISELKQGETRKTSEKDFATLCSNCHRMIHKLSDPSDIQKLKRITK